MWNAWIRQGIYAKFLQEILKVRKILEDLVVSGRIMLKVGLTF
jgi:hypothetical protein